MVQVVVHVTGSFQVYAMPVFDMMETLLVKSGYSNAFPYRLAVRSAYVVAVGFVAITLPFFGSLLGFLGATHCLSSCMHAMRLLTSLDMHC